MAGSRTRTAAIYRQMRADILEGRIEPGTQLAFARLTSAYAASIGVLREVLVRLTAEGLVVNEAQQGFRVVSLSLEDLEDLTATRCLIEAMVLRDSVQNGDLAWESALVAAHHRLVRTPQQAPDDPAPVSPDWARAHHEFHAALLAGAKSRRLQQIADGLRAAAEIYRRWSMPFERTSRNVAAEHRRLLECALARDGDAAAAALTDHLRLTATLITEGVAEARAQRPAISA